MVINCFFILRTAVSFSRLDQTELCFRWEAPKALERFCFHSLCLAREQPLWCLILRLSYRGWSLFSCDRCSLVSFQRVARGAVNVLSCTKQKALEVLKNPFQYLVFCLDLDRKNFSGSVGTCSELCLYCSSCDSFYLGLSHRMRMNTVLGITRETVM